MTTACRINKWQVKIVKILWKSVKISKLFDNDHFFHLCIRNKRQNVLIADTDNLICEKRFTRVEKCMWAQHDAMKQHYHRRAYKHGASTNLQFVLNGKTTTWALPLITTKLINSKLQSNMGDN